MAKSRGGFLFGSLKGGGKWQPLTLLWQWMSLWRREASQMLFKILRKQPMQLALPMDVCIPSCRPLHVLGRFGFIQ
jgi:hypothetical protein